MKTQPSPFGGGNKHAINEISQYIGTVELHLPNHNITLIPFFP